MTSVVPVKECRSELRLVVEGLGCWLDGEPVEIVDISAGAVRLLRHDEAMPVRRVVGLVFASEPGRPWLRMAVRGHLVRFDWHSFVYAYRAPRGDWPRVLARFDTFADALRPDLFAG